MAFEVLASNSTGISLQTFCKCSIAKVLRDELEGAVSYAEYQVQHIAVKDSSASTMGEEKKEGNLTKAQDLQRAALVCALGVLLFLGTGCSSLMCTKIVGQEPTPFAGVQLDLEFASNSDGASEMTQLYAWVDLPFSMAFDVSVLPVQMLSFILNIPGWGSNEEPYSSKDSYTQSVAPEKNSLLAQKPSHESSKDLVQSGSLDLASSQP